MRLNQFEFSLLFAIVFFILMGFIKFKNLKRSSYLRKLLSSIRWVGLSISILNVLLVRVS